LNTNIEWLFTCGDLSYGRIKINRSQCERIRTAGEIKANIILPSLDNVALYHKIREKVASLRALGMSFGAIAKSLNLNEKTARKAFYNQR
jgi:DNA-binding NarL/FixJ family response regulator